MEAGVQQARLTREAPRVRLLSSFSTPFDLSIAAARTCYMPRVVEPAEVTEKQRDSVGRTTFDGGHHTVYQHAHFVFGLENISRQFVWSVLHSHPFYNSEQSSQRFVRLDEVRAFLPPLEGEALLVYQAAIFRAWEHYRRLTELLKEDAWSILAKLRHYRPSSSGSDGRRKKIEREAEKKAIETARYVIPLAAFTSMVHTVSGISLHRLRRMQLAGDVPREAAQVIGAMVAEVSRLDPYFFQKVGEAPLRPEEIPELSYPALQAEGDEFCRSFDERLGGRVSRLLDYSSRAEELIAEGLRAVVGASAEALPTEAALERLLNPRLNAYRTDTLNLAVHSPMMRALHHASYSFMKKVSHTADSQDQRHRMVPASRPLMTLTDTQKPDYVVPQLIRGNREAGALFEQAMEEAWTAKNRLLELGVPLEQALYLLPNAKALRFVESGSLIYLMHKWTMRTCFNAQEEIYQASMDEIDQLAAVHPRIARHLGPPCVLRNGIVSPRCTEGDRFCGVPVWQSFPRVERPI
jgi:thymidylate synthase ThyX